MAPKIHDTNFQPSVMNMAESGHSKGWRRVGRHYVLLLWKNLILAKRTPIRTVLEITLPVFFGFLLLGIRHIVKSDPYPNSTVYDGYSFDRLPSFDSGQENFTIAYAPQTNFTDTIMRRVASSLSIDDQLIERESFPDEENLVATINQNITGSRYLGGVIFTNLNFESNITYKIRLSARLRNSGSGGLFNGQSNWKTNLLYPIFPLIGPRNPRSANGGTPGYYKEGFLTLQRAIDMEIINTFNSTFNSSNVAIQLRRYPFPPYKADNFVLVIQVWFPFLLVMSYIFAAINTVKNIVYEKERGLKVAMTIMGLNGWIHWLSWFTRTLIFLIIADVLIAACYVIKVPLKSGGSSSVIGESDITLVFFFLFTYSITSICFMFLLSTLFDKANSAAAGTGALWFLSYLPYAFIQPRYETMSRGAKMATSLAHNIGLSFGAQLIGMYEGKGTGLQWSVFNVPVSVDDNFTMADVIIMLYVDAVIYLVLALYIENIWPGQYGIPKGIFYPLKWSYWCGSSKSTGRQVIGIRDEVHRANSINSVAFEDEPIDKELGVQLNNVSKTYSFAFKSRPSVHAVRNLSMNIYSGQLTALLGHNGAGKSTTISMITGLIPPTSGQIIVNGFDIATSMDDVRDILGLCPQYNILFDHLTVREHLRLFATLKGHPSNDIDNEITRMVTDLMLTDKLDALSSALSGGMKRKLSVGIALIANSKVVILDEPTSGMDPAARRSTWEMLQRFRLDRTILFTTHFMDEADILGDRIAIMGEGRIRCFGSPFFLKTKYGVGYHLILSKDINSDPNQIFRLVQRHITQAKLESAISAECKILLPHGSSAKFPDLFEDLERNKDNLHIFSIGLSETSIEEVFMKIVEEDEPDDIVTTNNYHANNQYEHVEDEDDTKELYHAEVDISQSTTQLKTNSSHGKLSIFDTVIVKNTGIMLLFQQFYALLLKRIINSMRNYLVLVAALLPVLFVVVSLIIEQQIPKPQDGPPLLLSLDRYENTYVPYAYEHNESSSMDFIHAYESILKRSPKLASLVDLSANRTGLCQDGKPTDVISYLICIGKRSLLELNDQHLIGVDAKESFVRGVLNLNGYFNNQPYHTPPLTLNYLTNALLQQYSPPSMNNRTIHVVNHPLPRSLTEIVSDFQSQQFFGFRMGSSIVFGFGFMMAAFAVFLIKERVSKAKHLQFLSGANGINFWLSTFLWDLIYYTIASIFIFIIWIIFYHTAALKDDLKVFLTGHRLGYTILLYATFGFSQIPMTYLMTYIFHIPASGFAWITIYNIITSQATLLAIVILSIPQLDLVNIADLLEWIFLILFPNYCLGQGLNNIYQNSILNDLCQPFVSLCPFFPNPCCEDNCGSTCVYWTPDYLRWKKPGIGRFVVFMGIQSLVSFTILLFIDYRIFSKVWYFIHRSFQSNESNNNQLRNTTIGSLVPIIDNVQIPNTNNEDPDVTEEADRIKSTPNHVLMETDVLVLNQVEKVYNGAFHAVDQLSLGVKQRECFGLLGVNGAGKTTTFKMITGDETVDSGSIVLDSINLSTDMRKAQRQMGYCPQFDALIDLLTGEETLFMFARLRGVQESLIPQIVGSLIELMNLKKHAKKPVYAYSGGNKRKLSAAVGLIGDPSIVLLDEPTTGMDPKARRHFWNAIAQFRDHGKPIILTSHSMEECEALCTRLAIMVNGKFKCLGSIQHLKSKFGAGYTLMAKLNVFNETLVNGFYSVIRNSFPNSILKEAYEGFVHIYVNETNLSLAQLFRIIESCKQTYSIENYTVSQTTLEQVFLNFARSQLDADELRRRVRVENSWTQKLTRCCGSCC